ncbi:MAG: putative nucleotidyltransferase [Parvicellaceae bacterium]|jgi:predicted nucleotidyltransferase
MNQQINTKQELLKVLRANGSVLSSYGVSRMGLFGSFVRNTGIKSSSDVDLLVEFKPGEKSYNNYIDLNYYLESLLGRKVELLTKKSMSPFIGPHIVKEIEYVSL